MSESAKALIVVLEDGWRLGEGDVGADRLIEAIKCLHGVVEVTPMVTDFDHRIAVSVARSEIMSKVFEANRKIWDDVVK